MCKSREISFHALVGGQAQPGRGPAAKIREGGGGGNALHGVKRDAGAVTCADQRADAGAGDAVNGNACVYQRTQYADVRDAARKAASQRQPHAGALGAWLLFTGCEGTKLVLCVAQPVESVCNLVFDHAVLILVPLRYWGTWFDQAMPVL